MIWYLLYTLIFNTGGGEIFIPKLDNYVKEYVVDDVRKDSIVNLLEISQDKRKDIVGENKDYVKELKSLYESRETTRADFKKIMNNILDNQIESQKVNLMVIQKSKKLITDEEWINIQMKISASLKDSDEDRTERSEKLTKRFNKLKSEISETIEDDDRRKKAVKLIDDINFVYRNNFKTIQNELLNKKSAMFQYDSSEKELLELQNNVIELSKNFFEATFKAHFKLVELTTVDEWNSIY